MLGRVACAGLSLSAIVWVLPSCGTTTSVPDPVEAGCPQVILELDGGGVVEEAPDGAALCPAGACNYQSGSGCAAGSACRPQFTADAVAVNPGCEVAGSGVVGSACTKGSDCAAGSYCAEGKCRKQCCAADWTACDPGESCIRQVQVRAGGQVIDSGLALCFPVNDCDPLDTAPCAAAANRECKIVDPIGDVACEPLSAAQVGDPCSPEAPCAAGASCVGSKSDPKHCRRLCRAEVCGEPSCPAEEGICIHFDRDPAGVGECTPP